MKAIMRQAKNTVMQFSEIECKVREATSNDSWGASTSQMAEIAKATNDYQEYPQLFAMLWKRLNDVEHIMHVQKALILVEYLLRNGADRFINDAKRRARDIAALKKYKHYDANNQDDAKEARAKAKVVYDMLMDDAKLQEERAKALKIKDVRLTGFGSDAGVEHGSRASQDYGNGTGTTAAPPTRHQRADSDQADPFDSSNEAPSAAPTPARKSTAKDKAAAASTPDTQHTEPVKKKKKKKVVVAETDAAESVASESATSSAAASAPKLDAPAGDVKKKKKKKKAVTEDAKESEHGDGFDDPFSNGQTNGKVSSSSSNGTGAGTGRSFVDEFSGPAPITYQQTHQDVDLLTGRAPLRVAGSGDLVDLFSAPNPASPMNQKKLQEIAQQPFDPLGRDTNHGASSSSSSSGSGPGSSSSAPADLWQATDLMNLNDITKSNNKPNKKLAQTGPTMAQLRAQNPSTNDVPLSTLGFSASPAPAAAAPVPFAAPPYAAAAPIGYPPVQQMGALSLGYPPQAAAYPGMVAPGYPGYVGAPATGQPLLALMPPSAFQSGAGPVSSSPHADLPFAVQPGSRPQPAYNSNKPVIFDVVSAQKVAQAQADPHYNYNTSQRVVSARNNTNNLAANW